MDISEPLIETDTDTPTFFRNREMVRLLLSEHSALATELYENEQVIAAENDPFGLPPPSTENPPDNLAALFACELEQTTVPKTLKIKVVTFNASGKGPPKELRAVFDTGDADLFAVGLQELVEMRAGSIAASLWSGWEPLLRVWREAIKQSLRKSGLEFVLMADKNMMGLALLVFARKEVARQISGVEVKTVALGVMRTLGNKGSVAVRLNLMDASICFVTSHFASGKTNVDDRNSDFHLSVEKLDFKLNKWDYRIGGALLNSDTVIWFGDLNYRLQLKNESELGYVFSLIDRGELNELAQNDQVLFSPPFQLNNERSRNSVFAEFTEGEIAFAPTYKFVPGTLANYDKSEDGKQRMPAWCDRVLFKSNRLSLLEYDSVSAVRVSDHKPVCALFAARFRSFEPAALADFAARIGAKIGALKKVLRPKLSVFPTALEFAKMYFGVSVSRAIRVRNEGKSVLKVAVEVKCAPGGSAWAAALDRKLCVPLCRSKEARVEFKIDSKVVSRLRVEKSNPVLRAQIRLKIERGEDVVVQVKAVYMRSSFGCPLDFLCRVLQCL
ncbi:Inositol-1,4,5-trisphosphate 5-phosphatase 1 [Bonamia ostreae]|uniref:Inositol-1,4,5-trisphosphate 5-phosphatase 1 n=1 Tax=Bonamia ostreae TaxID=126728 RepID=A0ABV2AMF7_9EUKA